MLHNFLFHVFLCSSFWLLLLFSFSPRSLLLLSPCCGLSRCALHSQDSLLPLCLHTFMPAVAAEPPLPCFPSLNTFPAFIAALCSCLDHPPHAGCSYRKCPYTLLSTPSLFLFLTLLSQSALQDKNIDLSADITTRSK